MIYQMTALNEQLTHIVRQIIDEELVGQFVPIGDTPETKKQIVRNYVERIRLNLDDHDLYNYAHEAVMRFTKTDELSIENQKNALYEEFERLDGLRKATIYSPYDFNYVEHTQKETYTLNMIVKNHMLLVQGLIAPIKSHRQEIILDIALDIRLIDSSAIPVFISELIQPLVQFPKKQPKNHKQTIQKEKHEFQVTPDGTLTFETILKNTHVYTNNHLLSVYTKSSAYKLLEKDEDNQHMINFIYYLKNTWVNYESFLLKPL